MVNVKTVAIFVGGMLFGSAGFKILASKDAKKVYTQTTAAVLRMKDCTMETVSRVQEEAGDIRLQAALFMWWGTAAERMMPLSLCQNWQLGKLNKEIQL